MPYLDNARDCKQRAYNVLTHTPLHSSTQAAYISSAPEAHNVVGKVCIQAHARRHCNGKIGTNPHQQTAYQGGCCCGCHQTLLSGVLQCAETGQWSAWGCLLECVPQTGTLVTQPVILLELTYNVCVLLVLVKLAIMQGQIAAGHDALPTR
jgi:hypothetical protein